MMKTIVTTRNYDDHACEAMEIYRIMCLAFLAAGKRRVCLGLRCWTEYQVAPTLLRPVGHEMNNGATTLLIDGLLS